MVDLPRPRRPHQRDPLPLRHPQAEGAQHRLLLLVAELHLLEHNITAQAARLQRALTLHDLRRGVDQAEDPLARRSIACCISAYTRAISCTGISMKVI